MNLKKNILIVSTIILIFLSIPAIAQDGEEFSETVIEEKSKVAAYVNGEEISIKELEQFAGVKNISLFPANPEFESYISQTESGQNIIEEINKLKEEFRQLKLQQLINRKLLVQEAKDRGIEVSDQEMTNIFDQMVNIIKKQNNLNEEELEEVFKQRGYESMEHYKEIYFKNNMNGFLVNKLREAVVNKVRVSDEEAKDFYDNNQEQFEIPEQKKVSNILFTEKTKAEEVLEKINNGADFSEMAKKHSTGPTAENGGNMGFVTANEQGLDKTFRDAAMKLNVGELSSEPVKTQFGYHLIKVTAIKESKVREFEEIKNQIKSQLRSQKQNQEFQKIIDNLREKAEIEINL